MRFIVVALAVYAIVGFTSRPVGDDFCQISVVEALGPVRATAYWYETWSGRFSNYGLMAVLFGLFGSSTPALTPGLLIAALVGAWTLALKPLTRRAALVACAVAYGAIIGMPNVFNNFYWASSSLNYVAPVAVSGLLAAALIRRWHVLIIAVFALIGAGFNEPYALAQGIILLAAWWRWRSHGLIFAIAGTVIGTALSMMAPGNADRVAYEASRAIGVGALPALGITLNGVVSRISESLFATPTALIVPLIAGMMVAPQRAMRLPLLRSLLVAICAIGLVFATMTPAVMAVGVDRWRFYTLPQFLFAIAACLIGAIWGSGRVLSRDVMRFVGVIALLVALHWAATSAPYLIAEAHAADLGHNVPGMASRVGTNSDTTPYVARCRAGLLFVPPDQAVTSRTPGRVAHSPE